MRRLVSGRQLILLVLLLLLQHGFSPFFFTLKGRPDFFYLLVLDYAFFWNWHRVAAFALGVGLVRDFLGGHLFGIETASLAVMGWFLDLGMRKLDRESPLVRLGMSALFVALTEFLSLGLGVWIETSKGLNFELMTGVFLTTIYTTALAPGFFWFTNRWFDRTPVLKQYELFR